MTTEKNPLVLRSELFDEITDQERTSLQGVLEHRFYQAGETIIEEGSMDEDIYLLKSGVLDVTKFTGKHHQLVSEISGDTFFGDQAFLDGSPRSATVKAKVDTELFILPKKAVLDHPDRDKLLNKLYRNIAMINSVRLKQSASSYAVTVEKENNLLKEKAYIDNFIIVIMVTFSISQVIIGVMSNFFQDVNIFSLGFTWFYLIIMLGPFLYFVVKSGESFSAFGVTLANWKQSVFEGVLISLIMIGIMIISIITAEKMGYINSDLLTTWNNFTNVVRQNLLVSGLGILQYLFHTYGQEFVARGVFQIAFQRFLNDKRGIRSVCITSFLFGLSHLLYGPELVVASLVAGFLFGFIFLRHNNLLGVTIVHFSLGAVAFILLPLFADKL